MVDMAVGVVRVRRRDGDRNVVNGDRERERMMRRSCEKPNWWCCGVDMKL